MSEDIIDLSYTTSNREEILEKEKYYIPQDISLRKKLLSIIRRYYKLNSAVPPLTMDELNFYANKIINEDKFETRIVDYVKVIFNNVAWEEYYSSTPYNKRMLLLPPCLRNSTKCKAGFDEIGLLCKRCGACPIGSIINEAESLGYIVIIAEGTSIVKLLIERDELDAVLGVGCMKSLKRCFEFTVDNAIPAIAIPLLSDGCKDTLLDIEMLKEFLYLYRVKENSSRIIDLKRIKSIVDLWFTDMDYINKFLFPDTRKIHTIARDWFLQSGKRFRPFLVTAVYSALMQIEADKIPEYVKQLAMAVECIHKGSLIYDDVQDDDDYRYGKITLHKLYGKDIALTVSLFLIGLGYNLMAGLNIPLKYKVRLLEEATKAHCTLCKGQCEEMWWKLETKPLSVDYLLNLFMEKTSPSFEFVISSAALLCPVENEEIIHIISKFARKLGVIYQIRDDINDIVSGHDISDCKPYRMSIVLAIAYRDVEDKYKSVIEQLWEKGKSDGGYTVLMEVINNSKAVEKSLDLMYTLKKEALKIIEPLNNISLKVLFYRVISAITKIANTNL